MLEPVIISDALRCLQLAAMASSDGSELVDVPETRLGYDGRRYTKNEFLEWHGDAGERLWPDAGGSDAMVSSDASQLADGRTDGVIRMYCCVELKCAILTDCVNIPNVTIVIHPDATIGCVKNYLLAAIRSSGHQFEMRDFDDLVIALRNESDLSMAWPAKHDYTRITQTAAFKKSRKVLGDHWEVSLLFCMESNLEAKEQERRICRIRTPFQKHKARFLFNHQVYS